MWFLILGERHSHPRRGTMVAIPFTFAFMSMLRFGWWDDSRKRWKCKEWKRNRREGHTREEFLIIKMRRSRHLKMPICRLLGMTSAYSSASVGFKSNRTSWKGHGKWIGKVLSAFCDISWRSIPRLLYGLWVDLSQLIRHHWLRFCC